MNNTSNLSKNEIEKFKINNYPSTYGELTLEGVKSILNYLNKFKKIKNYYFYDLGSGGGNVIKYFFELTNKLNMFNTYTGIEFSETRHNNALKLLIEHFDNNKIKFINGDILENKYNKKCIIYISNLCFSENLNKKISKKLDKELKNGSMIFSSKKIFLKNGFLKDKIKVKQSWMEDSNLYCYFINKKKTMRKKRRKRRKTKKNK